MKENPALQEIKKNMKPGVISLHGFLGRDKRGLEEIIDHDAGELERLGISTDQIADKLEEFKEKAMKGLGSFITLEEGIIARADSIRGKLPCPFNHAGIYSKTVVTLRVDKLETEFLYTDLGIHMIREHGFLEGRGSLFRLEPKDLAELLKI